MTPADLLRVVLPPARGAGRIGVRCAWRSGRGGWQGASFDSLAAVAQEFQARRVELSPHPSDVAMTRIVLPPLPARRQRSAVLGAVELLALGDPDDLAVGYGPRGSDGAVPVAWTGAAALAESLQALRGQGMAVQAVFVPPAFLRRPDEGAPAVEVALDGWLVARTGVEEGYLQPADSGSGDADPATAHWTGEGWRWTLPMEAAPAHGRRPWLRPAVGWAAAVAAVWVLGLDLQASRAAAQGQALTRDMAAQVKAAFPGVAVVLNPLKQARQLRDARLAGAGAAESSDFAAAVRAATTLLPDAGGRVQSLDFQDRRLSLRWREGAGPGADERTALEEKALAQGWSLKAENGGLLLQASTDGAGLAEVAATPPRAAIDSPPDPASGAGR